MKLICKYGTAIGLNEIISSELIRCLDDVGPTEVAPSNKKSSGVVCHFI